MTRNRHIQLLTIEYAANARGVVKTHSYEQVRGLLLGTTYSDGTTARAYSYNHLGQLTQVVENALSGQSSAGAAAESTRTIGYNQYGEQETDSLVVDGDTHLITETRDALGRSTGYVYSKNGATQQTVTTGYGTDGRIASAGFLHGGAEKLFSYEYLPGTHLLQKLTLPSNMTLTQSYEPQRDLLTGMCYKRSNTTVAERTYTYDALGRPLTRTTSRGVQSVTDSFGYNNRSELTTATVNNGAYAYDYDNIGNRAAAVEDSSGVASRTEYATNELNQYTAISVDDITDFVPEYDADANQTRVKTSTGIWAVNYDSENRPIDFYRIDSSGGTTVHCTYDHMGRRATKQVTVGNNVTLHQRYIYRGYLQIACIDLTRSHHPALWYITWDATQPVATRPLAIQKDGTWYTYGWDLTKNICEVYGQHGYIRTTYYYTPYGQVTAEGDVEQSPRGLGGGLDKPRSEFAPQGRAGNGVPASQPIQWSSEFNDTELGLIYYNYRHYNPVDGRWIGRDKLNTPLIYMYTSAPISVYDVLGNLTMSLKSYAAPIEYGILYNIVWDMVLDSPAKTRSYIIQRIIREISYEECDSYEYSIKNDRQDYWEAWLVYKNEMRPKTPDNMDIDTWYQELRRIKSKRGDVVLSSVAKVVPRSVTGNLGDQTRNTGNYKGAYSGKSAWKKDEYNSMSNNISSTKNKPSWWDSYNPQNEKIATQKLEIVWDFCGCNKLYEMKLNGQILISLSDKT